MFFNNSFALDCNRTVTAAVTVQYNCDDNDSLTVNSGVILDYDNNDVVEAQDTDGVTIINNGTINNVNIYIKHYMYNVIALAL